MKKNKTITAEEFDRKFDNGEDVSEYLDHSKPMRGDEFERQMMKEASSKQGEEYSFGKTKIRRITLDLPEWVITKVDKEAERIGISRQAVIKVGLVQMLDHSKNK